MKQSRMCSITGKTYEEAQLTKGSSLRKPLIELIRKDHPEFEESSLINNSTLNEYRRKYLESLLKEENRELDLMEREVISSIDRNEILSTNIEEDIVENLTPGQKIADKIATFGGSWTFIITFFTFVLLWMSINLWILISNPFDPYPFILLNLILSCLAAIQAPIIMMSQNRKEEKDRRRSENDFKVNLKAELEIRLLHEKIDHMLLHQNQRLLEIQQIQIEFMNEILKEVKK